MAMAVDSPMKREPMPAEPRSVEPNSHHQNLIALRNHLARLLSNKVLITNSPLQCGKHYVICIFTLQLFIADPVYSLYS